MVVYTEHLIFQSRPRRPQRTNGTRQQDISMPNNENLHMPWLKPLATILISDLKACDSFWIQSKTICILPLLSIPDLVSAAGKKAAMPRLHPCRSASLRSCCNLQIGSGDEFAGYAGDNGLGDICAPAPRWQTDRAFVGHCHDCACCT